MAREVIDMNTVAPEARVVQPADIYHRPYHDKDAGSGFMQLAKALGTLGDTLAAKQRRDAAGKDEAHYANYQALSQEFGKSNNADVVSNGTKGVFDLFSTGKSSAMTRNRVEEVNGDNAAVNDFFNDYGPRLLEVAHDPARLQQLTQQIRTEAWKKVQERPAFGDSYIKQLDQNLTGFKADAFKKQAEDYEHREKTTIAGSVANIATTKPETADLHNHVEGVDNSLISVLSKGKPASYINDLDKNFSSRISQMIAAAPPDIRKRIRIESGARSPDRQAELIAAKLPPKARENFNAYIRRHGVVEGAAQWAAANPDAAKARGIGKMIALPGRSFHQHGKAIDFARDPVAEAWMHKNAGKYGLYYPMSYEPWHIEMVGGRDRRNSPQGVVSEGAGELPQFGPPQPQALYRGWDNSPNFFDGYAQMITGVENTTGDPNAKNPLSTATGDGQMIESTWLDLYGKRFGNTGETREQILAKRGDSKLSAELTVDLGKENAKLLEGFGIPVNYTTLLLSHQLGHWGAAKLVQAMDEDPSMPMSSVLSEAAMKANPQYEGKTVNDVFATAANRTGTFTNPVTGRKEQLTKAFYDNLHQARIGSEKVMDTFASAVIDTATANKDASILEDMPDEIMAIPDYAAKVVAARDKINTDARQEYAFNLAQQDRQRKDFADQTLATFAQEIATNPNTTLSVEQEREILGTLGAEGYDVIKKLNEFRAAKLAPTPTQQKADQFARAEASALMIDLAHGNATREQIRAKIEEIKDPGLYGSALNELAKYEAVPKTLADPVVKEMKSLFIEANYNYVEGTLIKDPAGAAQARKATKLYNMLLAKKLAGLGHEANETELLTIIDEVEAVVATKVLPTTAPEMSTDKQPANAKPQAQSVPNPSTGLTPEDEELLNKYDDSNRFIGVGPK